MYDRFAKDADEERYRALLKNVEMQKVFEKSEERELLKKVLL